LAGPFQLLPIAFVCHCCSFPVRGTCSVDAWKIYDAGEARTDTIFRVLVFGSVYAFYWNFVGTSFMSRPPNCYLPFSLAPEGYFHNFVTATRTRVSCNGRFVPWISSRSLRGYLIGPMSDYSAPDYAELLWIKVLPFFVWNQFIFCAIWWCTYVHILIYQFRLQWRKVEGLIWGPYFYGCRWRKYVTWFDPLHTLHVSFTLWSPLLVY